MIGSRVIATAALVALALVLDGGAPRPEVAIGATAAIVDGADRTLEAIEALRAKLEPAVDAAREGAASVVAGADDPAGPLTEAADRLDGASPEARAVVEALAALERARLAAQPDAARLPPPPDGGELASIAGLLRATADAGTTFAATRLQAEGLSEDLLDALDAIAAGRTDEAETVLRHARETVDGVRALEDAQPALTVWTGTADAMIRAMQQLVDAVRETDSAAAAAARAEFEAAAEDAIAADRALRIGLGEAGNAVSEAALAQLAILLDDVDALDAAVRSARAGAGR